MFHHLYVQKLLSHRRATQRRLAVQPTIDYAVRSSNKKSPRPQQTLRITPVTHPRQFPSPRGNVGQLSRQVFWLMVHPTPRAFPSMNRTVAFTGFVTIYSGGTARDLHPLPLPRSHIVGGTLGDREEGCQGHSCPGAPPPIIFRSTAFPPIRKQNERVSGRCSTPRNEPQVAHLHRRTQLHRMLKKSVQQGRIRRKHRRRSLWATLRMLSMRERCWRIFSASC